MPQTAVDRRKTRKRGVHDQESARFADIVRRLPIELARELSSVQLIRAYEIKLSRATVDPIKDQILESRKNEHPATAKEMLTAQVTLERLARIHSKTEPVLGNEEKLSERDCVIMSLREMRAYDPAIIERNIRRALPKQTITADFESRSAESGGKR